MEILGQKFVASVAQGKIPGGGRSLRTFPDQAQLELDEARLGFDSVARKDNGPQDLDPRPGHIAIELGDSRDGGYREHRYEAHFKGTAEDGTMSELRHFPASGGARAITDATWTTVSGQSMTHASYLQLEGEGRVEYASVNHVNAENPEKSRAVGWNSGFDSTSLEAAVDWQLLK